MSKVTMWEAPGRAKSVDETARELVRKHGGACRAAVIELMDAKCLALDVAAEAIRKAYDELTAPNSKSVRELIEDMWSLWRSGCDCTECPERVRSECERDEHLGIQGCNATGYIHDRAASMGMVLKW